MTEKKITVEMIKNQVDEVNNADDALRLAFDTYRKDTKAINHIHLVNCMNRYQDAKILLRTLRIQKKASEL